jgi:hypothetical protein
MSKLREIKIAYKEKKMKTINDWLAFEMSISVKSNYDYYFEKVTNKVGEENHYWVFKTFYLLSTIIEELQKENITNITNNDILNLDFLIPIAKNNNKLDKLIKEFFNVKDNLHYSENTIQISVFYQMIMKYIILFYQEKLHQKLEANGYEYIIIYNKKENVYEIYYLNETIKIKTKSECFKIYKSIQKEKLIETGSLKIAEFLSY